MKKRVLFGLMLLVLTVILALGVQAKEYSPTTGDELNSALAEIAAQSEDALINLSGDYTSYKSDYTISGTSNITFNFTGDSELAYRMVVNGESKVVFNLNGHTLTNKSSRGGVSGCLILLDDDATLEIYNGAININDVGICFQDGTLKMEGVNFTANEEVVWCNQGSCDGSGRAYYINNCTMSGNDGINAICVTADSYITNCEITKGALKFDAWHKHGDEKISPARFENITSVGAVENHTSGNYYVFKNCTFGNVAIGGDNGGDGDFYFYDVTHGTVTYRDRPGHLYDYKSASCTESGSLTVYDVSTKSSTVDESYALENPALGHTVDKENAIDLIYTSYYESGKYLSSCIKCGQEGVTETEGSASALFVCLGYSAPESGDGGISLGYKVDHSAIEEYTRITGKEITHGLFAVAKKKLGDGDVLNEEYKPTSGVISAELPKNKYSIVNLKIVGFTTDEQKSAELVLGMYAIVTSGDKKEVVYLQNEAPKEGDKYHFVSYNNLVNN